MSLTEGFTRIAIALIVGVGGLLLVRVWIDKVIEPINRRFYKPLFDDPVRGPKARRQVEMTTAFGRVTLSIIVVVSALYILFR